MASNRSVPERRFPSRWQSALLGMIPGLAMGYVAWVVASDMPRSTTDASWLLYGALGIGAFFGAVAGAAAIPEVVNALRAPAPEGEATKDSER